MSRVFVTQQPRLELDMSEAERFGALVPMLPAGNLRGEVGTERVDELRKVLMDFDEDKDFILPMGDLAVVLLVGWVLSEEGVKRIKVLRFSNGSYYTVELNLEDPFGIKAFEG